MPVGVGGTHHVQACILIVVLYAVGDAELNCESVFRDIPSTCPTKPHYIRPTIRSRGGEAASIGQARHACNDSGVVRESVAAMAARSSFGNSGT